MFTAVATRDPVAVENKVQAAYVGMFPEGNRLFVPMVFGWTIECFTGHFEGYQAVDARYHDLEHTMQGTLCLARLLSGRHHAGVSPRLSQREFELTLLAILLHDTGYLKRIGDTDGTGAKYTATHVARSADFAKVLLAHRGFVAGEIKAVQNMILCTGVNTVLSSLEFQSESQRLAGFALATADLLGQMAADDYLEKLPVLFSEFAEASAFSGERGGFVNLFRSPEDLIAKTPAFWRKFVLPKLQQDFQGLFTFLNQPYPDGPNEYVERIERNMERLESHLSSVVR
jgi:hypothetical protein